MRVPSCVVSFRAWIARPYGLLALAILAAGCNDAGLEERPDTFHEEHSQANSVPPVDILWVVDNSGSMEQEQEKVADGFAAFIQYFLALELDFHMAITTTDTDPTGARGAFVGATRILDPATPDLVNTFMANAQVGIDGSGDERGLEAARLSLSEPNASGANAGFLRPDALLAVIIVSDEEDVSADPVDTYVNFFRSLKANDPARVSLSGIVGDVPNGCENSEAHADPGVRYHQAIQALNGIAGSICADDFTAILDSLGSLISGMTVALELKHEPTAESIRVRVDGVEVPNDPLYGWTWSASQNAIVFATPAAPEECARIEIDYVVSRWREADEQPEVEPAPEGCTNGVTNSVGSLDGGTIEGCAIGRFGGRPRAVAGSVAAVLAVLPVAAALRRRRR